MPEGPEIRLAADRVAKVLVGQHVEDVFFALPELKRKRRRIVGSSVTAVDTRGKAMLTRFDSGLTLYSHNQLYGRWMVQRAGELPRTNRQLRFAIYNSEHSALLYSASAIEVLREEDLSVHPFLARIGPDVLDPSHEHVHNVAVALDLAAGQQQEAVARRLAVPLVDVLVQDEVGDACFVLERHEHDALSGGGALAHQRHARDADV